MFPDPNLPYPVTALEPVLSRKTMAAHLDKHRGYVRKVNEILGSDRVGQTMLNVAMWARFHGAQHLFNAASQAFAHEFFWTCMHPVKRPQSPRMFETICNIYEGPDKRSLLGDANQAATALFGSGWLWLLADANGYLRLAVGKDAELPFDHAEHPILCVDLWEHAYYIDFPNKLQMYLTSFFMDLCAWDTVTKNYTAAVRSLNP